MNEEIETTAPCSVCEGAGVVSPMLGLLGDGACPGCEGSGIQTQSPLEEDPI